MTAALKCVDSEKMMVDCLHRDLEGPCPCCSVTQESRGGIKIKIQLRKLITQLKESPILHSHFIVQLFTVSVIFKVYKTICFTCFETQHGLVLFFVPSCSS